MSRLDGLHARSFGKSYPRSVNECIESLRQKTSGVLPNDLIAVLKPFDGASVLFDADVIYKPLVRSPWDSSVDGTVSLEILFGLCDEKRGLGLQLDRYHGRMPTGVIPIGGCGGGNLICLALKGSQQGKVFFWDHEDERDICGDDAIDYGNMYLVAESFDDFINLLTTR